MNHLCIEMTQAHRRKDAEKKRKALLRLMKKHVRVVEKLARGHLSKLRLQGTIAGLSAGKRLALERKSTAILDRIDDIIHQAHERIIGGCCVKNKDKILSLYDPDIHMVARKKAHAEVEFDNTLFLAEQTKGLIVDWYLYQEQTPADHAMIPEHLQRMENEHPITVQAITGDRGLDSVRTAVLLGNPIVNYLCPRQGSVFERRLQDDSFRCHQRRHAQTEAHIAIVTHGFLGNPMRKGDTTTKSTYVPGVFSLTTVGC